MRAPFVVLPLLALGCTTVQDPFTEVVDASQIYFVEADVDQGDFVYQGFDTTDVTIDGRSWGNGRNEDKARARMQGNSWQLNAAPPVLQLLTTSTEGSAGIDLNLVGPRQMGLSVVSEDGPVSLLDVDGVHVVTAERITGEGLLGDVDFYATEGDVDVDVWPYEGGSIRIETTSGGVDLYLPRALAYDVQIWGDVNYEMTVDDLGWSRSSWGEAYFAGVVGFGDIAVDIYAVGGPVHVYALR